jgi:1,4-dihydroxy-2-naphthoate octaprenyltransferase
MDTIAAAVFTFGRVFKLYLGLGEFLSLDSFGYRGHNLRLYILQTSQHKTRAAITSASHAIKLMT